MFKKQIYQGVKNIILHSFDSLYHKNEIALIRRFFCFGFPATHPPPPPYSESLEGSSPRTGKVASVSSEPQALTVSFLHPSTEFPSSRSAHCRMAARALAILSTLHTRRRKGAKWLKRFPVSWGQLSLSSLPGSPTQQLCLWLSLNRRKLEILVELIIYLASNGVRRKERCLVSYC